MKSELKVRYICNSKGPLCPLDCPHAIPHKPVDYQRDKSCNMDMDYCGKWYTGKGYPSNCICVATDKETK